MSTVSKDEESYILERINFALEAIHSQVNKHPMTESPKRSQEYKDFRFRHRYDHFLRFRLSGAKPEKIIETARELGFNLTIKDLAKKRVKKIEPSQNTTLLRRLKDLFQS